MANTAISDPVIDIKALTADLNRAAEDALHRHKQAGVPVVAWRDGKIAHIPAEQVVMEEEPAESQGE